MYEVVKILSFEGEEALFTRPDGSDLRRSTAVREIRVGKKKLAHPRIPVTRSR